MREPRWVGDTPISVPVLALGLLALGLAVFGFAGELLGAANHSADWHAYYRAARKLLAGRDIYDEGRLLVERDSFDFWIESDGQYVYPPLLALVLAPLAALLTIRPAGDVWLAVLTVAAVGAVGALSRVLDQPRRLSVMAPALVVVLASVPLRLGVRYGQVDVVLWLLVMLALLAHQRRRDVLAGVALGVAAAVKPTLALYGLFYLRKRCWATLAAAVATGLAVGLGPFALLGPAALGDWLTIAAYFGGGEYPTYPSNQSLRGFLLRALVGGPRHLPLLDAAWLANVLWLIGVVGAALVWWRSVVGARTAGPRAAAEYGLTAALVLIAAPLSEDIHFVMLLTALALLADRATWDAVPTIRWRLLALGVCLYFAQPWLDEAYYRGESDLARLLFSGAYLYGALLVAGALLGRLGPPDGAEREAVAPGAPAGRVRERRQTE